MWATPFASGGASAEGNQGAASSLDEALMPSATRHERKLVTVRRIFRHRGSGVHAAQPQVATVQGARAALLPVRFAGQALLTAPIGLLRPPAKQRSIAEVSFQRLFVVQFPGAALGQPGESASSLRR